MNELKNVVYAYLKGWINYCNGANMPKEFVNKPTEITNEFFERLHNMQGQNGSKLQLPSKIEDN
jgi:hypothetical protein